jgi:hypothetical protein
MVANAAVRLHVAADVEKFSQFHNVEAMRAQERFIELMPLIRALTGIDEAGVVTATTGDNLSVVQPA